MEDLTPYRLPDELEKPLVVEPLLQDEMRYEYLVIGAESAATALAAVAEISPRSSETRQPMGRRTCSAVLVEYEGRVYVDNATVRREPVVSKFECEYVREWANASAAQMAAIIGEHGATAFGRPPRPGAA